MKKKSSSLVKVTVNYQCITIEIIQINVYELFIAGQSGQDVSGMSTTASSWHYSPTSAAGIADFSPLLKKYTYQLSVTSIS